MSQQFSTSTKAGTWNRSEMTPIPIHTPRQVYGWFVIVMLLMIFGSTAYAAGQADGAGGWWPLPSATMSVLFAGALLLVVPHEVNWRTLKRANPSFELKAAEVLANTFDLMQVSVRGDHFSGKLIKSGEAVSGRIIPDDDNSRHNTTYWVLIEQ